MFGAMPGQYPVGERVDRCAAEETERRRVESTFLYASSISSKDSAEISTPLPNAITPAMSRWGTRMK